MCIVYFCMVYTNLSSYHISYHHISLYTIYILYTHIGIVIVFGAIAFRIQRKLERKPLNPGDSDGGGSNSLWKQPINLSNIKVVHEWHEHLDI